MLNTELRIAQVDSKHVKVDWETPWPDGASWVFVNGKRIAGPHVTGTAERTMRVPLADGLTGAFEVHDFEETDADVDPIEAEPNSRPLLGWRDVPEAVRFRIYHKERNDAEETLIYDRARRPDQEKHHILCPIALSGRGGKWHLLRVEAVDEFGNESTRESWAYFVSEPAAEPGVSVVEGSGSGLYTVTVTEP